MTNPTTQGTQLPKSCPPLHSSSANLAPNLPLLVWERKRLPSIRRCRAVKGSLLACIVAKITTTRGQVLLSVPSEGRNTVVRNVPYLWQVKATWSPKWLTDRWWEALLWNILKESKWLRTLGSRRCILSLNLFGNWSKMPITRNKK